MVTSEEKSGTGEEKGDKGKADALPVFDFFTMRIYSCVIYVEKDAQHKA